MQHKQTLIAAAITAALAVSSNVAAEATVYGKIHTSVASVSQDVGGTTNSATQIKSNASRLGFKANTDVGGGLSFIGQLEMEIDYAGDTTKSSTDLIKARNTFVGVKGGFGTVLAGVHDTPHKISTARLDPFADTYADYNNIIKTDHRLGNVLAYINQFGNVGFAAAYYAGDDSVTGENTGAANSVMVNFDQKPLYVAAAVENYAADDAADTDEQKTATKLGAGYTFGPATVGLVYETSTFETSKDRKETYVSLKYKTGGNAVIKAAYGMVDDGVSGNNDPVMTALGVDFKMDKKATIYALYANGTDGGLANKGKLNGDASAVGVGIVYKF